MKEVHYSGLKFQVFMKQLRSGANDSYKVIRLPFDVITSM